jgi:hypothetical protein
VLGGNNTEWRQHIMTRANRFRTADDESAVVVDGAFGRMSAIDVRVYETRTWNRFGLEALVAAAISFFQSATGVNLPWNLPTHGPWVGYPKYRRHLTDEVERMVESAARFAGWLRAAAKLPAVVWLVAKATSNTGMNSPYTVIDLWSFSALWPSPGRLNRTIVKVRERANQILEPYGLKVSGRAVAVTLARKGGQRAIGKAAREAAASTINQLLGGSWTGTPLDVLVKARGMKAFLSAPKEVRFWAAERTQGGEFSSLRDALASASRLERQTHWDEKLVFDPTHPDEVIHNVSIRPAWTGRDCRYLLVQEHTGRVAVYGRLYGIEDSFEGLKEFVTGALEDWRRWSEPT